MEIEKVSFQRILVSQGYIYVCRSCRSGWFDVFTLTPGYGDLLFQGGFKPDINNFESAWDVVIANYENDNIFFEL